MASVAPQTPAAGSDTPEWWRHPFRIFQTNIREVDSGMDVQQVVRDIVDFGCNTWLLNAGGIVSHYPSRLPHQHPSPWLKERPGGDLLGDAIEEAHKQGVRVIARCDFSKLHRDQFEQHPDWFFVSRTGQRQVYEGLYSACPSGPYYQEKSLEVITEILDRYAVDAFFFNWFGMSTRDYSGTTTGSASARTAGGASARSRGAWRCPRRRATPTPATPCGGATRRSCWRRSPGGCGR